MLLLNLTFVIIVDYAQRHMSRDDFLATYIHNNSFISVHDAVLYLKGKSTVPVSISIQWWTGSLKAY